jgi:hypothetical protein
MSSVRRGSPLFQEQLAPPAKIYSKSRIATPYGPLVIRDNYTWVWCP